MSNSDNTNFSAGMSSDSKEYLETHPIRREIVRIYNPRVADQKNENELKDKDKPNGALHRGVFDVLSSALSQTSHTSEQERATTSSVTYVPSEQADAGTVVQKEHPNKGTNVAVKKTMRSGSFKAVGAFSITELMRGIVMAEVLGPPKSRTIQKKRKY